MGWQRSARVVAIVMWISSARPEDLERYVSGCRGLNESLRKQAGALTDQYRAYSATPSDYPVDLSEAVRDLTERIAMNEQGDQWVQAVAHAFREADSGGELVITTDAQIAGVLIAGGLPDQPPSNPLDDILNKPQVADDEMVQWEPPFPASLCTDPVEITRTEAQLLGLLSLAKMKDFKDIKEHAEIEAEKRYPGRIPGDPTRDEQNNGHMDAFRHAYWNALMADKFGQDFATRFGTAHEGVPGNEADREAMDLYNNSVGRRIAREHPDASREELAGLVRGAVERGEMVVIDRNGELAWSNQVPVGQHGRANDPPRGGRPAEPGDSGDVESRGAGS